MGFKFNPFTGTFDAVGSGGGATTLDGLSDVTAATPTTGDILQWNGSAWVNVAIAQQTVITAINYNTGTGEFTYDSMDLTVIDATTNSSGNVVFTATSC